MATQTMHERMMKTDITRAGWLKIGLKTALISVVAVLIVQAIALAIWPDLRQFKPLDSYPRTALFTLVPALGATAVFAWFTRHLTKPGKKFIALSAALLLLSFIPDYVLPLEGKTVLGSTVAAFMHLVAGIVTVTTIVASFRALKSR